MAKTKILFILFLVLLIESLGSALEKNLEEEIFSEFEDFDDINEDEEEVFELQKNGRGNKVLVNVDSFGAAGDGTSDDTKVKIMLLVFW